MVQKIEDTTISELLNRNSENKINVELTSINQKWIEIVNKLELCKGVEVIGNKLKIEVENIELNKNMLLAKCSGTSMLIL